MRRLFCSFLLLASVARPALGQPRAVARPAPATAAAVAAAVTKWPARLQVSFVLVNNLPVVQATVDGQTGNFMLDTGAEATLLNQRYFVGVPATAPTGAGATGAFRQTAAYRVGRFDWQGLTLEAGTLPTLDLTHLGAAPLLGLLGADLLAHYAVTLDYTTRTVVLRGPNEPPPPTPPRLTLPFTRQGHLPVIPVSIAGQSYELAIDSGASVNMLAENLLPTMQGELSEPFTTSLDGAAAGSRPVAGGTLQQATLAQKLPLRDMATIFTTIGPLARSRPPIVGILGYEFLRQYQVTINYPQGVVELR